MPASSSNSSPTALVGFTRLTLARFPADWLRPRMWALRHNLSAYDATYVALTEMIGATALLTTDTRLANAPGITRSWKRRTTRGHRCRRGAA